METMWHSMAMRENVGNQSSWRIPSLDTGLIKHYDSRRASNQSRIGMWLQQGGSMERPKKTQGGRATRGAGAGTEKLNERKPRGDRAKSPVGPKLPPCALIVAAVIDFYCCCLGV